MSKNFEQGAWFPIMVNPNYFLLDGQRRLATAQKMKLKFIDIVVDYGDFEQEQNKPTRKSKQTKL